MIEILLDYDNLPRSIKRQGIVYIAELILSKLTAQDVNQLRQARIRLYGGWYSLGSMTRRAQLLATDIQASFPRIMQVGPLQQSGPSVNVNVEIACSMLLFPTEHLLDTYRIRAYPDDLIADHPVMHGCTNATCPLIEVYEFITNGHCASQTCCTIRPSDLIHRGQQKLVDTMLTNDLLYLSLSNTIPIVLVTSDDDFWPSIRTSLYLGVNIIHVHTIVNRQTAAHYAQYANQSYIQRNLT